MRPLGSDPEQLRACPAARDGASSRRASAEAWGLRCSILDFGESSIWRMPSVLVLVAVNLAPLYGVLAAGWDAFPMLFLFWAEGVVIGVFHVLRMLVVQAGSAAMWVQKLFLIPFFLVHYGGFAAGHGIFLIALFGREAYPQGAQGEGDPRLMLQVIRDYRLAIPIGLYALSHGVSFAVNFLGKGEYRGMNIPQMFMAPYARVIVMHLTLIGSAFLMTRWGAPAAGMVALVALKTVLDVGAHLRERGRLRRPPGPQRPGFAALRLRRGNTDG